MSQVTTMRVLSCSVRCNIAKSCVSTTVKQSTVAARHQRLVRQQHYEFSRSRFKSTTAPPSRRQQSTAFAHSEPATVSSSSSSMSGQQVARSSVFKQVRDQLQSVLLKPRTVPVPRWVSPQHYTVTLSEVCGHASFILVAVSYAMDDFLELRIIAVAGSTAMLFFTYFHPHGRILWLPFKWNLLFIAINSYRIGNVFLKRFHAEKLPSELLAIRDDHFYVLDPVDFYKLVQLGRMETFKPGDLVVAQVSFNLIFRRFQPSRDLLYTKLPLSNLLTAPTRAT